MKPIAFVAACALCLANTGHAARQPGLSAMAHYPVTAALPMQATRATDPDHLPAPHPGAWAPLPALSITRRDEIVTPLSHLPQLPEPQVFAMMLVGLVLIGYRVSRDGGDKFT